MNINSHTCMAVKHLSLLLSLTLLVLQCSERISTAAEPDMRDLLYANVGDVDLKLDLYGTIPLKGPQPVIVWIHGGAWRSGNKMSVPIQNLSQRDYVIASVDYRLSPIAKFPAQIHDIKAAIRFLRANAVKLNLDPARIAVAGASAGGHLANLVGVSHNVEALEGAVGNHRGVSSHVGAIVSFYGAANLTTILQQSTPHGLSVRAPALDLLLGGQPDTLPKLANMASPVRFVDPDDPPLLLIHGDQDPQMPINQSHELFGQYRNAGLAAQFEVVYGGKHGGSEFFTEAMLDRVDAFLSTHLASATDARQPNTP